jgi:SpoVK/Ycf46/Vps4 family AAA+-type ATPase
VDQSKFFLLLLLTGATNRPQELDEAARRRLSKRLYIPLPSAAARAWIVRNLLGKDGLLSLTDAEIESICTTTDGYSGSDMKNLVKEASMGPLREALMQGRDIGNISKDEMRPISVQVSSALLNTISLLSCSLDAIILPTRVFLSLLLEDA